MTYQEEFNDSHDPRYLLFLLHHHSDEIDPSVNNNHAIRWVSYRGDLEVVKELLKDERVDPSDWNNFAIRMASKEGHLETVKLLLKDSRVDPSADNNQAIIWASKYGHIEIVKLLEDHIKYGRNKKFYSRILINI